MGQRLVLAVLGPGLRQRLQLDVGRLAPLRLIVPLDRLHLGQRQRQTGLLADLQQPRVIGLAQRHLLAFERPLRRRRLQVQARHPGDDLLDGIVGQRASGGLQQRRGVQRGVHVVAQCPRHTRDRNIQVAQRLGHRLDHRVHHARPTAHRQRRLALETCGRHLCERPALRDGIGQQATGRLPGLLLVEIPLEQIDPDGANSLDTGNSQVHQVAARAFPCRVMVLGTGRHLDLPEHGTDNPLLSGGQAPIALRANLGEENTNI